uniref:EcoAI/FtnUII family type I restriction enzme subunit R n=1 Tax=Candidatus Electronema sp. TaxID=2698783 RepID=UPI004055AD34
MNEADTRAELIDPQLQASGWGIADGSKILREYAVTDGRIQGENRRGKQLKADYLLLYKGIKLATVEAKRAARVVGEGVAQAKLYAEKLGLDYTFAANGREIRQICMKTGEEKSIAAFPSPDALWQMTFSAANDWKLKFLAVPFESCGGRKQARFYQDIAVRRVLDAIADGRERILLTLATGTGKTFIAFQIAWKLHQSRWNLRRDGSRRPRILFLADRNILANQAFNDFSAFKEDELVRIRPYEISKKGKVPTSGSVFFTIFQTFMTSSAGSETISRPELAEGCFSEYPPDFFDFIIIDECHRGGANDEGSWRGILEYFAPAVQLGLTATPKRADNADTYRYFGEPVYIYSLKEGIEDGFLTPFRVRQFSTSLDEYSYDPDDDIVEGSVDENKKYTESEFNRKIEIREREAYRVELFLAEAKQDEKTLVFCANQAHAALIRDLFNERKRSSHPNWCVRVTADDGALGDQYLEDFQDNEKSIPAVLTTSQKLSTGVDARNVRNIVLLRPINSMIEFKQIIGRGTRLFDGKAWFSIYDFVNACRLFADPEWDGEPIEPEPPPVLPPPEPPVEPPKPEPATTAPQMIKIRLADGKEREIEHSSQTLLIDREGRVIPAAEYLQKLFGELPQLFQNEDELRRIWSQPMTRKELLNKLEERTGCGPEQLAVLQRLIRAEDSDLFDVLEYVAYAAQPVSRAARADHARRKVMPMLDARQQEFIEFVLSRYVQDGVAELDMDKLTALLELKYRAVADAVVRLGSISAIRSSFIEFQGYLYDKAA